MLPRIEVLITTYTKDNMFLDRFILFSSDTQDEELEKDELYYLLVINNVLIAFVKHENYK